MKQHISNGRKVSSFPLPQYAFMAWCSVTGSTGTTVLNIFFIRVIQRFNILLLTAFFSHWQQMLASFLFISFHTGSRLKQYSAHKTSTRC